MTTTQCGGYKCYKYRVLNYHTTVYITKIKRCETKRWQRDNAGDKEMLFQLIHFYSVQGPPGPAILGQNVPRTICPVTQKLIRCQNWSGRTSFGCNKWSAQVKTGPGILFIVRKITNSPLQLFFCHLFMAVWLQASGQLFLCLFISEITKWCSMWNL